jgi:hypothetical protein
MPDYTPEDWDPGDTFTADDATAMSQELEEQEDHDAAQDALIGAAYTPGGTDVALGDGGTGASLTDPGADRLMFWDDSAGSVTWLTLGTNLSITNTTINAAGGGGGGTVDSVVAGNNIDVDATDPANPVVSVETLTPADIGLSATATELNYVDGVTSAIQTQLDGKVDENSAITGATKTKVTYDAKGLVTAGADATTADIADSSNKRYVTDAQQTVIGNTSGTNSGDQTSIVGITGTKAQFDTAVTDGNIVYTDAIGSTVQAYDADLTTWGGKTAPSGDVVGTTDTQTLSGKTHTNPTINNYTEGVVAVGTVTTAHTFSLTNGTVQTVTLTASTGATFTMPTATAGKSFTVLLKQAASTGNGSATFTGVKWDSGGTPTVTTTAGKMDIFTFISDGTNWYGSVTQGYTP